ncbi:MAG: hypothetical protein E7600_05570 [Ruminococcaceae bacterium]|nr:hypothetical protein [Oscillospiraceae bacterium]
MTNGQNIAETIKDALNEARTMADSQTIIGEPIVVGSTTIIPVSKISIGVGLGGGTYGKQKTNNAGVGGTGVTITPVSFIVVDDNGRTSLLNVGINTSENSTKISGTVNEIDKALDSVPGILSKIKDLFVNEKVAETKVTVEDVVEETTVTE